MPSNNKLIEKPLTRIELLAGLIIFLLPLFTLLIQTLTAVTLPQWTDYVLLAVIWGCIIFAVGLAVVRRLPRWSLPYLGSVLMPGIIIGLSPYVGERLFPAFVQSFGLRSYWSWPVRILYSGVSSFITLFLVLLGALLLVNLLRLLPYTHAVWQHIRADWTLLSFLVYGGLVSAVWIAFEEYRHEDMWKFAAWLCLALGAWFYLRAKGRKQRIWALIGGATGAMWMIAIGQWVLTPLQDWQGRYSLIPMQTLRRVDTGGTIIGWIYILLMLIAPVLLNWLPPSPPANVQEDIASA